MEVSKTKLKKDYDVYAPLVLSDSLTPLNRKKGQVQRYKVAGTLPTAEEYKILKLKKYSMTYESAFQDAIGEAGCLLDEMGEWQSNMDGTGLENTDKYQMVSEACDYLQELDGLEDSVPPRWPEGTILVLPLVRSQSRSSRACEAAGVLREIADRLNEMAEEDGCEDKDDVLESASAIEDAADTLENIEFPGMF